MWGKLAHHQPSWLLCPLELPEHIRHVEHDVGDDDGDGGDDDDDVGDDDDDVGDNSGLRGLPGMMIWPNNQK